VSCQREPPGQRMAREPWRRAWTGQPEQALRWGERMGDRADSERDWKKDL